MLKCTVDAFLSNYCPFSPDDVLVDAAIQTLGLLVTDEHKELLLWKIFKGESSSGFPESSILGAVQDIAGIFNDKVEELNGRKRHFFFRSHDGMKVKIPGSNLTLDACFSPNSGCPSNEHDICTETAVAVQVTGCIKDSEDDCEKLVSAVSRIMNDDPRRMWMYGIIIENTKMAVWHFSRSLSVKSELFDVTKDFRSFIRVFLSFTYATPKEMGYDPTVHRIIDKGSRYVYEIPTEKGTRYFKTIGLIAHQGAFCTMGKNTRVWRAVEVKGIKGDVDEELNGGREVALKDVWLDDGSKTEKQKLDAIFQQLKTIKEDSYRWATPSLQSRLKSAFENEGYKDYFMEIVCDSFDLGRSKMSDQATSLPAILDLSGKVSDGEKGKSMQDRNTLIGSTQLTGYSHSVQYISKGVSCSKVALMAKPRLYKVKRQYRLVYKEVGQSLDRVETLETAFTALLDAYIALVLMHLAGWMHRDVSAGNIIAVKRSGGETGGKLSDLEYAKHCEDESGSSDPKTGTAFFMPLEIHIGMAYKDSHTTSRPHSLSDSDSEADVDPFDGQLPANEDIFSLQTMTPPPPPPPLKYRFQHGFESLWWIALYLLTNRVDHPLGQVLSKKVFTSASLPTLARRQLFENRGAVLRELTYHLHPALQHQLIIESMDVISELLYHSYFMDEPVDPEYLGELYRRIFRKLARMVVFIKTKVEGVKLVKFHPIGHVQPRKRAHRETSSKYRDNDKYQGEEEGLNLDGAMRKKKKKASAGDGVGR